MSVEAILDDDIDYHALSVSFLIFRRSQAAAVRTARSQHRQERAYCKYFPDFAMTHAFQKG